MKSEIREKLSVSGGFGGFPEEGVHELSPKKVTSSLDKCTSRSLEVELQAE